MMLMIDTNIPQLLQPSRIALVYRGGKTAAKPYNEFWYRPHAEFCIATVVIVKMKNIVITRK